MDENAQHLLFTDGSSLGNPGPGGWGTIVVRSSERVIEMGGGEQHTTNNRMELLALIEGLRHLEKAKGDVVICLDSSYVHKGATQWSHAWIKNGWQTKAKKDVENRDLWERLLPLLAGRKKVGKVAWKHLPGHSGIAGNERADEIATGFAKGDDVPLFKGELGKYDVDILNITVDDKVALKRSADRAHSRAKAYSYLSLVDGRVLRHLSWVDCEKHVIGKAGARYKKALSPSDESAILKAWGVRVFP